MPAQLVVTDLSGRTIAHLSDWESISVIDRIDAARVLKTKSASGLAVVEARIGRALKFWLDGNMFVFNGKIWEPRSLKPDDVVLEAHDPLDELAHRRCQVEKTYAAVDAGLIAKDRVDIQNARRNTYLRTNAALVQPSVNRDRTYGPGKLESEILTELADVERGYFFRATPVDGVVDVMCDLRILYPDAGTTRENVRFEYGPDTLDNLADYEIVDTLPDNSFTAASSNPDGGRIAQSATDDASVAEFGLFEDEVAFSDVSVVATLLEHAKASVQVSPPKTIKVTPAVGSPLLFRDFVAGDFVRLRIRYGTLDMFEWVRVLEATMEVDIAGNESLAELVIELVVGGSPGERPERFFRSRLDSDRARLEALERRVENIDQTINAPPANDPGGGSDPVTEAPPPPPAAPPPPPPPPPPPAPVWTDFQCFGTTAGQYASDGRIDVMALVDLKGLPGQVEIFIQKMDNTLVIDSGWITIVSNQQNWFKFGNQNLFRGTQYKLTAFAKTSAGQPRSQDTLGVKTVTIP